LSFSNKKNIDCNKNNIKESYEYYSNHLKLHNKTKSCKVIDISEIYFDKKEAEKIDKFSGKKMNKLIKYNIDNNNDFLIF
jgi:hypothetical protein